MDSKSKRIAKNTIFLYIRMLFVMFITLFTSRVVLDKLGIEDFGINNVVGGLAMMFAFFSSSLTNATQRFLNIELGLKNPIGANHVFNQHLVIYVIIICVVVLLAETIGLWFVMNKLVIPLERLSAALWVYQFTIISLAITLIGIVFNSMIIAHEDMKIYSYVGMLEGVLKLIIAYAISVLPFDRLITYSFLLLILTLLVQSCYACYCFKCYEECKFHFIWNKKSIKETFSFISWNFVGTAIYAVNDQGINILLNVFFGPIVNAARAISYQVSSAINNLGTNFYTAVRPQLVKSYAAKDYGYLIYLFFNSSKYSFFLMWMLCLPVMLSIDTILNLWLKEVPQYTNVFTRWILAYSLVNILTNPIWSIMLAVGKLKKYISIGSGIMLINFPIAYFFLKWGYSPVCVFISLFLIRLLYLLITLKILREHINFSFTSYLKKVLLPCVNVFVLSAFISIPIYKVLSDNLLEELTSSFISIIMIIASIWMLGCTQKEKMLIRKFIKHKIS